MAAGQRTAETAVIPELQGILKNTGVGVWCYDGARREFILDDVCRELFDIAPGDELNPALLQNRLHPEDIAHYWRAAMESESSGEYAVDYRIVRRDGSIRFVSSRGRVKPRAPGEPVVLNGVLIDLTGQKTLEQQLRDAELRARHLAEALPGLFVYVDSGYIVRFVNARCGVLLGGPPWQLLDRPLSDVLGAERFAARKPVYERVLAGEVMSAEVPQFHRDGSVRWYAMTYQPDPDPDGQVRGFMALGIDVTEKREALEALEARTRELARSNHDLEQFAYVASHDLKAPLRSIDVLVDWLREDLAGYGEGEVQENLGLLKGRTARLNQLLDDLLAYSRAGRTVGDVSTVDSRQLVEDLALLLAPPPGMRIEADASLPRMTTHPTPLEQVLRNLINNAIKHHPTGRGLIRVSAAERDGEYLFAVQDDGAGIAPEFSEKVFQMFQTLKPRDQVEGSGMGLAIVKRIVEWQGGRIWFHAGPDGRGTVFRFTWKQLPAETSHAPSALQNLAG